MQTVWVTFSIFANIITSVCALVVQAKVDQVYCLPACLLVGLSFAMYAVNAKSLNGLELFADVGGDIGNVCLPIYVYQMGGYTWLHGCMTRLTDRAKDRRVYLTNGQTNKQPDRRMAGWTDIFFTLVGCGAI